MWTSYSLHNRYPVFCTYYSFISLCISFLWFIFEILYVFKRKLSNIQVLLNQLLSTHDHILCFVLIYLKKNIVWLISIIFIEFLFIFTLDSTIVDPERSQCQPNMLIELPISIIIFMYISYNFQVLSYIEKEIACLLVLVWFWFKIILMFLLRNILNIKCLHFSSLLSLIIF